MVMPIANCFIFNALMHRNNNSIGICFDIKHFWLKNVTHILSMSGINTGSNKQSWPCALIPRSPLDSVTLNHNYFTAVCYNCARSALHKKSAPQL